MAYYQDSTINFSITLVVEGIGKVTVVGVYNTVTGVTYTGMVSYTNGVGLINWSPSEPIARLGDGIDIGITLENQGNDDNLWTELLTTMVPLESTVWEGFVGTSASSAINWTGMIISSEADANITINAGHVIPGP